MTQASTSSSTSSSTASSPPPTRTEQQLAMLDDDGNPHHPDEPDFSLAASARIAALMRIMRARPYLTLAVGVALGFVVGAVTARAR